MYTLEYMSRITGVERPKIANVVKKENLKPAVVENRKMHLYSEKDTETILRILHFEYRVEFLVFESKINNETQWKKEIE